jgi:mono/diheme cytochrome c family protein
MSRIFHQIRDLSSTSPEDRLIIDNKMDIQYRYIRKILIATGSFMMKRSVLIVILVLLLTACGSNPPADKPQQPAAAATATQVPPPTQVPAATALQPAVPATESQPGPSIDGAALLQDRCADCHTPEKVKDRPQTKDQWDRIVTNMISRGANLNDAEKQALVDYLAKTYGK